MGENRGMSNWKKINYNLHRDLGFFFFGLIVIYSISGIALNHRDVWNPMVEKEKRVMDLHAHLTLPADKQMAKNCLILSGIDPAEYLRHINKKNKLVVLFKDGGSLIEDQNKGEAVLIVQHKRPFFYQINALHKDFIKQWKWMADILAFGLILLCITGVVIVKGKKGIRGRGGHLMAAGFCLPLIYIILHGFGWI